MTWLEERAAELRQAEAEIPQLKQMILQADQTLVSLRRELNSLRPTINEPTPRRQQLCIEIFAAMDSKSKLDGRLHRAKGPIYVYVLPPQSAYTG